MSGTSDVLEGDDKEGQWITPPGLAEGPVPALGDRVIIVSVVGDSMAPTLNATDRVMVDTADRTPSPPGMFVVWDGLGLVVKRVEYIAHSAPAMLRLFSDNARYAPYECSLEDAHIRGRVIAKWQWL
jgi:phage repressor protein C with HTH and peptisase S24 domain